MSRRVQTLAASLFVASLLYVDALGQQRTYPAYTVVTRYTEYDAKGEQVRETSYTRYQSSSGDWRVVARYKDHELATLYRRGRGVYQSYSLISRLIKQTDHAPGCPLRTGKELRADPKFDRTEEVLGFTAYVLIDRPQGLVIENYYVPELGGGMPFKQVTRCGSGPKVVKEPISITLGEPAAIDVTGPDYLVIEQQPVPVSNIGEHLVSKPEAYYPTEALASRWSGVVQVSVAIDEGGHVILACVPEANAPPAFREAAAEAAYRAIFNPIIKDGRLIVARGIIEYQFVAPN